MSNALGHCVHFDGSTFLRTAGCCAAGVEYRSVVVEPTIRLQGELPIRFPCHSHARGHVPDEHCPSRRWPTPEEVAAAEAETERVVKAVLAGRCPECGSQMQRHVRPAGGYVENCPRGCDVGVIACGRRR